MSSQRSLLIPLLLLNLMLPPLLCTNLFCFYSPYITKETKGIFKLVVTECPPRQVCFKSSGKFGEVRSLTHHGCVLLQDCNKENPVRLNGTTYNNTYSCCDSSYCNTGSGLAATVSIIIGSLSAAMIF